MRVYVLQKKDPLSCKRNSENHQDGNGNTALHLACASGGISWKTHLSPAHIHRPRVTGNVTQFVESEQSRRNICAPRYYAASQTDVSAFVLSDSKRHCAHSSFGLVELAGIFGPPAGPYLLLRMWVISGLT